MRYLYHAGQQAMREHFPVGCALERLPLQAVAHTVALRTQLPRRAPERLLRHAVEFVILRPRQRANNIAYRQLFNAARGAKAAGRFPNLHLIAILQPAPFDSADTDFQIGRAGT